MIGEHMRQRIFTLRQIIETGRAELEAAGVEEAALDAWYLLEYTSGISRAAYYGEPERILEEPLAEQYLHYIGMRKKRIPLQHITGEQEFMGYPFYVNEHVLIPRQDTETLVEEAVKFIRAKLRGNERGAEESGRDADNIAGIECEEERKVKVLDMCTGSGCILLSIMKLCPQLEGTGCDISGEALAVARKNAERLEVDAKWIESDLFDRLSDDENRQFDRPCYDVIVSNPPYIRTAEIEILQDEVRLHDPRIALDGKEDGLYFYRRIVKDSVSFIKDGGSLIFEIGWDQGKDVAELMTEHGYENVTIKKDLSGLDRVAAGVYNRRSVCGSGFL